MSRVYTWMFWVMVLAIYGSCAMFGFGICVGVIGGLGASEGL